MNNIIESIIFAIMGAVILAVGIVESAGVEIIVLGAVVLAFAVGCLIYSLIKKKKNK